MLPPEGITSNGELIPQAHKVVVEPIPAGAPVIRYGQVIGYANRELRYGARAREEFIDLPAPPDLDQLPLATDVPEPLPPFEVQELWFATLRAEWTSLAVVPAHAGGSAYELARALAEAGSLHRGTPVRLVKADANDLPQTARFVDSLSHKSGGGSAKRGGEVIVAVDPVVDNPLGIAIALAADAVLVTIELGVTDLASARRTVEMVGRERLLGCVVVRGGR